MKYSPIVLAMLLAGCVSGCATAPPQPRVTTHTAEVPTPCSPKKPPPPASAVDLLPLDAPIDDMMRALRADRVRDKAYEKQLLKGSDTCK